MCKLADAVVSIFLGLCAWSDWKTKEISMNILLLFSGVIGLFFVISQDITLQVEGFIIGILFFVVSKVTKEAIGYGDSWLILLLGVYLGGKSVLLLLFWASVLSGICSLVQVCRHRWRKGDTVPFVPFMFLGYIGVMLL